MLINDTPNNVLMSFALFGRGSDKGNYNSTKLLTNTARSGEINLMLDSGAFSAFTSKGYEHVTLDNYCRFITRFGDNFEKYVMLDVIGNEDATKRNYETMLKRGFNPMYVYTMTAQDDSFLLDALKNNANVCVAGGAATKGDWMIQRYQRVVKMSEGKAKIHGLAFVTFPRMLQCGLASVDSSSWAVAPMKYAGIPYFKDGIHMLDRRRLVAGLKKGDKACKKIADKLRLTVKDLSTEGNFHTTCSIPFYIGVRAYMEMQRYCYRRGLRLFFAIADSMNQLRAIQYHSRNWQEPRYQDFIRFVKKEG